MDKRSLENIFFFTCTVKQANSEMRGILVQYYEECACCAVWRRRLRQLSPLFDDLCNSNTVGISFVYLAFISTSLRLFTVEYSSRGFVKIIKDLSTVLNGVWKHVNQAPFSTLKSLMSSLPEKTGILNLSAFFTQYFLLLNKLKNILANLPSLETKLTYRSKWRVNCNSLEAVSLFEIGVNRVYA